MVLIGLYALNPGVAEKTTRPSSTSVSWKSSVSPMGGRLPEAIHARSSSSPDRLGGNSLTRFMGLPRQASGKGSAGLRVGSHRKSPVGTPHNLRADTKSQAEPLAIRSDRPPPEGLKNFRQRIRRNRLAPLEHRENELTVVGQRAHLHRSMRIAVGQGVGHQVGCHLLQPPDVATNRTSGR